MLGEMIRLNGCINTRGQIAYVPQQAWMQNATLQNNILFGKGKVLKHKQISFKKTCFFKNHAQITLNSLLTTKVDLKNKSSNTQERSLES